MNDFFDNWTVQARKGLLEMSVLAALTQQERYGYDLARTLLTIPGLGVTEGTLYPLLSRLRRHGLIESRLVESNEGPARKYYALTEKGRQLAASMNDYLNTLVEGMTQLQKRGA